MPADLPTEGEVVRLVRQADARAETPVSAGLWSRVEDRLAEAPARRSSLRVVHSATRRMRRLAAVAAVLLAVLGLTWYAASRQAASGTLVSEERLQRTLDREALEGPLELDGRSRPLGRDLYRGVAVKEGDLSTDVIRACNPC